MNVSAILGRLGRVRRSGAGWSALCPAHDDHNPSLSVTEGGDGKVLLKCHALAGCTLPEICAAMGIGERDLFPEDPGRGAPIIVAQHAYRDETGALLFEVLRYSPKGFRQRKPDGRGGWSWSTHGVRQVPYRLPELLASGARRVFVVEGEKDADRLAKLGFIATTNAGGAGKWKPEFSAFFRGRHVIILPDDDEAGRRHADSVARSIHGTAASVRMLCLPNLPAKGDVSDWLAAGGTRDELKHLAKAAPEWSPLEVSDEMKPGPVLVSLDSVRAELVAWLWRDRVPFGKITLLDGDPGLGKSTLALEVAARVTRGEALPGGDAAKPMAVVILSAEDGLSDTIRPRLDAARADSSRIKALTAVRGEDGSEAFPSLEKLEWLEAAIVASSARLVIVDPLMAYLGVKTDSFKDQHMRRALAPLAAIAEKYDVAVLIIRHLNKGAGTAIYRGGGSIGIIGAARSALIVAKDPEDEGRRIVAPVKSNLCAPPAALAFRLKGEPGGAARVEWDSGSVDFTADSLLAAQAANPEERSALDDAKVLLRQVLADGARTQKEVLAEARGAGVTGITLRRAKTVLAIKSRKLGLAGPWTWELPGRGEPEGDQAAPKVITPTDDHLRLADDHLRGESAPDASQEDTEEEVAL